MVMGEGQSLQVDLHTPLNDYFGDAREISGEISFTIKAEQQNATSEEFEECHYADVV
jgi:hypothetical protein